MSEIKTPTLTDRLGLFLSDRRLLPFMLAVQFFGFFFDDNIFYAASLIIYAAYLWLKPQMQLDAVNRALMLVFVGFLVLVVFSNITRIADLSLLTMGDRNWKLVITPLIGLMLVDASYSLAKYHRLAMREIAPFQLFAMVAGTISFILVSPDAQFADLIKVSRWRTSGIVDRNFNIADDVHLFLFCSIAMFSLFYLGASGKSPWRYLLLGLASALALYCLSAFIQSHSRGAWLGLLFGSVAVAVIGLLMKRAALFIVLIFGAASVVVVFGNVIEERLERERPVFEELFKNLSQGKPFNTDDYEGLDRYSTSLARYKVYANGWSLVQSEPVFGHGNINLRDMSNQFEFKEIFEIEAHVHNLFLDVMIRQGVGLLIVYLIYVAGPVFLLTAFVVRNRRDATLYYAGSIFLAFAVYLFVENQFDLTFIRSDPGVRIQYVLMAIYGLLLNEVRLSQQNAEGA